MSSNKVDRPEYRRKIKIPGDNLTVIEQQVNELGEAIMASLRKNLPTSGGVYRLYYGNRYVVVKGKTIAGSIFLIVKGYAYFLFGGQGTGNRNEVVGPGRSQFTGNNLQYWEFYSYINNHIGLKWHIETILQSDNGYELLMAEQQALNDGRKNKKMLNSNIEAYIPKYRAATKDKPAMYGWITEQDVLAFQRAQL